MQETMPSDRVERDSCVPPCDVTLVTGDGTAFTVPGVVAWQRIGLLRNLAAFDGGGSAEMPPVELDFGSNVVHGVVEYLRETSSGTVEIPMPLTAPLDHFVPAWEMEFARRMEQSALLLPTLECAQYLYVTELSNLLSAYAAQRIDEISHEAPSIMEGAAQLREYLRLDNEWTHEEMKHLEEEMRYVKAADPGAY
ncbi:Skp1 family dimerization domain [Trypanosoma vivax]|uniref:SKP1 component POZ domain-containing protein n=1 Tax=Trypanosoma vivax (strain Y486) TaxID=1055687 RepID=G0U8L0_TRYVY|nr:hypothetical protein TRVL_00479 [Trypanosoma vivax]KAH8605029.1 Skp1 family dimerization domain [Trypanosoma vivax]CCC53936.1 conserved hypothetical protein [Trypanosoma vivax Y486]